MENDHEERGVLDIKNCRFKKSTYKNDYAERVYGFTLIAKGQIIEFQC